VGGKGANQAVTIARAGGNALFYGTIGRDGDWIQKKMHEYQVDTRGLLVTDEQPTGRAIIQVDRNGENSIILFPGANHSRVHEEMDEKKPREERMFLNSTHLLLQNEIHVSSTYYAIQNSVKAIIIMNPSPLPSDEEIQVFPWDRIDWLIVNEAEAEGLYCAVAGVSSPQRNGLPTKELVFRLSQHLAFRDVNIVCTLGADGVLAFLPTFHRPKTVHEAPSFMYLPAAPLVGDVKDTTGAGDCFTGYFVQGLMEYGPWGKAGEGIREQDIVRILKTCVHAAGMCVEKRGTIDSIPTRAEVETRMLTYT